MKKRPPIALSVIVVSLIGIATIFALRLFIAGASTGVVFAGILVGGLLFIGMHGAAAYLLLRPVTWAPFVTTILGVWAIADPLGGVSLDSVITAVLGIVVVALSWVPQVRGYVKPRHHAL